MLESRVDINEFRRTLDLVLVLGITDAGKPGMDVGFVPLHDMSLTDGGVHDGSEKKIALSNSRNRLRIIHWARGSPMMTAAFSFQVQVRCYYLVLDHHLVWFYIYG
jgi:hypothetical protein